MAKHSNVQNTSGENTSSENTSEVKISGKNTSEVKISGENTSGENASEVCISGSLHVSLRRSHHSKQVKSGLASRLNRIEGQIRGIKGLIEKDTYCDDVLNQIAAVQSALNSVGKLLLAEHLKSCVVERIQDGELEVVDELLKTMHTLMK